MTEVFMVVSMPKDFVGQAIAPRQFERLRRVTPAVEHPVVAIHPDMGRKLLYASRNLTKRLKRLSPTESTALPGLLVNHIEQPEFECRQHGSKGTTGSQDNPRTQHYTVLDYHRERTLHPITVGGEHLH